MFKFSKEIFYYTLIFCLHFLVTLDPIFAKDKLRNSFFISKITKKSIYLNVFRQNVSYFRLYFRHITTLNKNIRIIIKTCYFFIFFQIKSIFS